jgi:hypothetical protein
MKHSSTAEVPMAHDPNPLASVGFRHVIEDGLAILKGQQLQDDRKRFVLTDLARIADDAAASAVRHEALMFSERRAESTQIFLLLKKRIPAGDSWQNWLKKAASAFTKLAHNHGNALPEEREAAQRFLSELSGCLAGLPRMHARPQNEGRLVHA